MKTPPANILCQTSAHNWREVLFINLVKYYRNGARIYQSLVAPGYPLVAAASLINLNATVTNAMIVATPTTDVKATTMTSSP